MQSVKLPSFFLAFFPPQRSLHRTPPEFSTLGPFLPLQMSPDLLHLRICDTCPPWHLSVTSFIQALFPSRPTRYPKQVKIWKTIVVCSGGLVLCRLLSIVRRTRKLTAWSFDYASRTARAGLPLHLVVQTAPCVARYHRIMARIGLALRGSALDVLILNVTDGNYASIPCAVTVVRRNRNRR